MKQPEHLKIREFEDLQMLLHEISAFAGVVHPMLCMSKVDLPGILSNACLIRRSRESPQV